MRNHGAHVAPDIDLRGTKRAWTVQLIDSSGGQITNFDNALKLSSSTWEFGENTAVVSGVKTTILSFTIVGADFFLDYITATGDAEAEFEIVVGGSVKTKYRTAATYRTMDFVFPFSQKIASGTIIEIKVTHEEGVNLSFNSSILGHKE